jgi:hypothetical protein
MNRIMTSRYNYACKSECFDDSTSVQYQVLYRYTMSNPTARFSTLRAPFAQLNSIPLEFESRSRIVMPSNSHDLGSSRPASNPIVLMDKSPVQIEPHDDEDDDEEETPQRRSSNCGGFALLFVGIVWLVVIFSIILNLMHKPLFMVSALVVANVVFPILFFSQWFGKGSNYESLDQDEDDDDVEKEEDFQFSIPKAQR